MSKQTQANPDDPSGDGWRDVLPDELLQKAQRYDYGSTTYMEAPLQPSESGDWIAVDDVVKAIQILEGQQ